jgi:hypothetical protein
MTLTLTELLEAKLQQVQKYEGEWLDLQQQVLALLGTEEADDRRDISQAFEQMQEAIQVFTYEIKNPRITLATTGTTSGGKSSLVNLLCGASIMPVAVQEMNVGTVIIDHDPTVTSLKIPLVDGLPPELSGEWTGLGPDEIRRRLTHVMDGYRQLREEHREPPAPQIHVRFPTRVGSKPELAGLPDGFRLRIIDLPGFKHIADEHNRRVIHDEIRPALCLVTYNSEETDSIKQGILLDEIVDQVREIRGSPARMLFILNRIDVFRRDADWEGHTRSLIAKTMDKVRRSIADALPEFGEQAARLQGQPLSTGPALDAHVARAGSHEDAIRALEHIDRVFHSLMPKEVEDLPRSISKWAEQESRMIADSVWRESYGAAFDETLRLHVRENLPQLLLPHLLQAVVDVADACLTTTEKIAYAHVHSYRERYESECRRLDDVTERLKALRNASQQELLQLIKVSGEDGLIGQLTDRAKALERRYKLLTDSMVPLHDWYKQIGKTIDAFFSAINGAMIGNERPTGQLIDSLALLQQEDLIATLTRLRQCGYGQYAANGGYHEARTQTDKDELKAINEGLNKLSAVLAGALHGVLDRVAAQEAERVQRALEGLMSGYANSVTREAQKIAPHLTGLSVIPSGIARVQQRFILNFVLFAGFPVHRQSESVQTGSRQVVIGQERVWYTLWLMKRDVYETQPVYEMRTYEQAVIPSADTICIGFIEQAKASRTDREFMRWLEARIEHFLKEVDAYQEDLLREYRSHLDRAKESAKELTDHDIAGWEARLGGMAHLRAEVKQLNEVK